MGVYEEIKQLKEQGKSIDEIIQEIQQKYPSLDPVVILSVYYAVD